MNGDGVDPATRSRWREAFTRCLAALPSYRPRRYSGRAVVFTTTGSDSGRHWQRCLRGGPELVAVPGDHYTLLRLPHVAAVARALSERLAAVDAEIAILPPPTSDRPGGIRRPRGPVPVAPHTPGRTRS